MKYALQIYGVFRTFRHCLPQILHYIQFEQFDYDVFILSQRSDGYSPENENIIRNMMGSTLKELKYIEDFPHDIHAAEDSHYAIYAQCTNEVHRNTSCPIAANGFVTRLWYRRWLNNQIRIKYQLKYQIKYDWVIRTRFDIGRYQPGKLPILSILNNPPNPSSYYAMYDVFACGAPEVIDYESQLINHWPYIYLQYKQTHFLPKSFYYGDPIPNALENQDNERVLNQKYTAAWLFMSEQNLADYIKDSPYQGVSLNCWMNIVRQGQILKDKNIFLNKKKNISTILSITYGNQTTRIDITRHFLQMIKTQSIVQVTNESCGGDPVLGQIKELIITYDDGETYIAKENTTININNIFKIND